MLVKNALLVLVLVLVWIILSEGLSLLSVGAGLLVGIACSLIRRKYLPLSPIRGVRFFRLALYPLFLIGQIYLAGFNAIKLLLFGSSVEIVTIKTSLKHDLLRVALANSITLTPGTISLDLEEDRITVLWLREPGPLPEGDDPDSLIKGKLEKMLAPGEA